MVELKRVLVSCVGQRSTRLLDYWDNKRGLSRLTAK